MTPAPIATERTVPQGLLEAIQAGECVAFVGAGFSACAVPPWTKLLRALAAHLPADSRAEFEELLASPSPSAFELEAAAQFIRDALGNDVFLDKLRTHLNVAGDNATLANRRHWLLSIPFQAVLTTNFDGALTGLPPGRDAYLAILRPREHRWWDQRFWDAPEPTGPVLVKIHGDLARGGTVVITRRDYRQHLHSNPGYQTFLRTLLATRTVLYLGFSFTDAYLNELRSETLALLDYKTRDAPLAYAIANDVSAAERRHYLNHEGIDILSYDSRGGTDFSGFDAYLCAIHRVTNPSAILGRLLLGRRLMWVDPQPTNNSPGKRVLEGAARTVDATGCRIDQVSSWEQAVAALSAEHFDLVITHWGHDLGSLGTRRMAAAERLLEVMHAQALHVPVIVFATGEFADANKPRALRAGALAYCFEWATLFRVIESVFAPGSVTG
jgi:CheY-like chemotaxis protein